MQDQEKRSAVAQIQDGLQRFHKRTFPSSNETSGVRHDVAMSKLDELERKLAAIQQSVAAFPDIEKYLSLMVEVTDRASSIAADIDRKLALLSEADRKLNEITKRQSDLEFLLGVAPTQVARLSAAMGQSKSQLGQDIFVLAELSGKQNGFFVEFGATDGVDLSNTWLLEKKCGWNGILAEPAKVWQQALRENRSSAIEAKCVWKNSNETLDFSETQMPELSTLNFYVANDEHSERRKSAEHYAVETISLVDLLSKYQAPKEIDYLSIDTEGSEFDILESFDFDRYEFKVITCEHNFTPTRQRIFELLTAKGYRRKFEELSRWDDWYVKV